MKISEVSEKFDLTPETLRYYERIGLIPSVNRNESGIREYTETDMKWVDFIKCMRNAGLPIEVLTEYVELVQQGDHTNEARKQILIQQRDDIIQKMDEMQKTLDLLNHKIEVYEERLLKKETAMLQPEEIK